MELSFGARLRQQREDQRISLAAFAEQSKIKLSLLEGLERDDLSHWPHGIFRRSYIRSYAQAIGLDPEVVLREFLEHYPDPLPDDAEVLATAASTAEAAGRRPPMRLRYLIGSAIDSLHELGTQFAQKTGISNRAAAATEDQEIDVDLPLELVEEIDAPHEAADHSSIEDECAGATVADAPVAADDVSSVGPRPVEEEWREREEVPRDSRESRHVESSVDLPAIAALCTKLAGAASFQDLSPLMKDAATTLRADGLILWMSDPAGAALYPLLSHGYASTMVAQLPPVHRHADNAIARAFRLAAIQVVESAPRSTGAIVVPLTTPMGCSGVLALEMRDAAERCDGVRACATILAAQLSLLVGSAVVAHAATA